MHCPHCGSRLNKGTAYCNICGKATADPKRKGRRALLCFGFGVCYGVSPFRWLWHGCYNVALADNVGFQRLFHCFAWRWLSVGRFFPRCPLPFPLPVSWQVAPRGTLPLCGVLARSRLFLGGPRAASPMPWRFGRSFCCRRLNFFAFRLGYIILNIFALGKGQM
jgi:hypothetical protein